MNKLMLKIITLVFPLLLIVNNIYGIPRFAVKSGASCITCHINPTGAGMRNDYGVTIFSMDELPMERGMKFTDDNYTGRIGDYLQFGADFRFQMLSYAEGDTIRKTAFFPMQGAVYGHLNVSKAIEVYYNYDLVRGAPQFWTLLKILPNNGYLRFGREIPNYGLKLDDHTSMVRGGNIRRKHGLTKEGMAFSPLEPFPGMMEVGMNFSDIFITLSIANGYVLGSDKGYGFSEGFDDKTITGRLEYSKAVGSINGIGGISIMKEQDFIMRGIYGGVNWGKLTWLGELDIADNWVGTGSSLASYSEFIVEPIQGVNLLAKFDFFDEDIDKLDNAITRVTGGLELFPYSFLEIKVQARFTQIAGANDQPDPEFLIQLHTWF